MKQAPTVLIVDDAMINVKLLDSIFQKEGFQTITADNGPEARALARSAQPDLILLDIVMPDENGFETCAQLKLDEQTTDIPVIFLSARDDTKSKVQGLTIGAVDYITKPFEKAEVLARARVHIKLSMARRTMVYEQSKKLQGIHKAQKAILTLPADLPGAQCGVCYRPLQEAGGDFYDIFQIANGIYGYFVADISGHDIQASFLTSALKALIRQNASPLFTPKDTVKMINSILATFLHDGQHITACYAHVNRLSRRLTLISAGHPPVLFMSKEGRIESLKPLGDILGVFDAISIEPLEMTVSAGDRFFLFTDGLIENLGTKRKTRMQGIDDLTFACLKTQGIPLKASLEEIMDDIAPPKSQQEDDLLLLGVEI